MGQEMFQVGKVASGSQEGPGGSTSHQTECGGWLIPIEMEGMGLIEPHSPPSP